MTLFVASGAERENSAILMNSVLVMGWQRANWRWLIVCWSHRSRRQEREMGSEFILNLHSFFFFSL